MVMTRIAHLARGYCCGSGCRHCPFQRLDSRAPDVRADTED
ncbi:MAG: DUF5522 domain-containing protein [Bdellovibrionota bacterium]|nr:MAG: DUF5522 domain-containing protein [Bdellovibrionota bacterium]